jgi:hypothetical protein
MHSRWAYTLLAVALAWAGSGCRIGDLGNPCKLVRVVALADGGTDIADITQGEIDDGLDYVSFGVAGCEDFICVRDANFVDTEEDPGLPAGGYCTRPCNSDATCVSGNATWDNDPALQFRCVPLLLDEVTLGQLCEQDPKWCVSNTPNFCARRPVAE